MRNLPTRFAMTLVLAFLLWIPTHAASPSIIMIYGEPLERPLFVTGYSVTPRLGFLFFGRDTAPPAVTEADLKDRAFLKVAMFWGGDWWKYVEDRRQLSALRPEDANQHGRLYLPTATQPAAALKTPGFTCLSTTRQDLRRVASGPPPAWPMMPIDPKDLVCAVKLTTPDAQVARELGIPGF
jgi:hypothetical protein